MAISSEKLSLPNRQAKTPRRRGYVFLITALTVFLLGLIFLRTGVRGYVVTAELSCQQAQSYDTDESPVDLGEAIREEITTDTNLKRALEHIGAPTDVVDDLSTSYPDQRELKRIGNELHVESQLTNAGPARILLTHIGRDSAWSTLLVDRLAHQLLASRLQNEQYEQARQVDPDLENWLDETLEKEAKTQQALNQFLAEHFEEITAPTVTIYEKGDEADEEVVDTSVPELPLVDNPAWLKIKQRLDEQIDERDALLIKYTAAHPRVRDLDWGIQQIKERLDQTPRHIVSATPQVEPPAPRIPEPPTSPKPTVDYASTISQYEELKQKFILAQSARSAAQETYDGHLRPASQGTSGAIELISSARAVGRIGGAPQKALLILLGALALIAATAMARWAGGQAPSPFIRCAAEVEQELSIEVVGEISTTDGPELPPQRKDRSRLVKAGTLACELTLGAMVFGFLLMALMDSALMGQFFDDPFGAISETVSRAVHRQF